MANILVIGAGIGGMSAAYELRQQLPEHQICLIDPRENFEFTPSNPWVAIGWRSPEDVVVPIREHVTARGIDFVADRVTHIDPLGKTLGTLNGYKYSYDYLLIATGPELAFDEVPGLGPCEYSHSVCTNGHAHEAADAYEHFLTKLGPVVIGAVQGASCFGPAYEFALILDADLRKRRLRDRVPITLVTSEPYIGHLGLGGVGDSKGLLETELRDKHIRWVVNAKVESVQPNEVVVLTHDERGGVNGEQRLPSAFTMLIPAFRGVAAVRDVPELCNPRGFVLIDAHQRSPRYPEIYAAGVCVAIPPVEVTPVPTGAPKTGYMIESMVTAAVANIAAGLRGEPPHARATWNAICLADMGDHGVAFVALPQIPPRNLTWARGGRWVHLAKVAFEKYFMHKMRTGNMEPVYERYVLKALGIERLHH